MKMLHCLKKMGERGCSKSTHAWHFACPSDIMMSCPHFAHQVPISLKILHFVKGTPSSLTVHAFHVFCGSFQRKGSTWYGENVPLEKQYHRNLIPCSYFSMATNCNTRNMRRTKIRWFLSWRSVRLQEI